jgi:hypothetical protein
MRFLTLPLACAALAVSSPTTATDTTGAQATPEKWTVSYETRSESGTHRGTATFQDFWILPADGKYSFATTIRLTGYIEEGGGSQLQAQVVTERTGDKLTLSWRWLDPGNGATSWVHTADFITMQSNQFQGVVVSENQPGQFAVTGHKP